jgi:hypothetical protein
VFLGFPVFCIAGVTPAPAQAPNVTGAFECSAPGDSRVQKLLLFPDGRWLKMPKGSPFGPSNYKLNWISAKTGADSRVFPRVERDPRLRGTFQETGNRVILYTLQPGILHSGMQMRYEKPVPDALLVFEQWFEFDSSLNSLIEIVPAGAIRKPLTCSRGRLF